MKTEFFRKMHKVFKKHTGIQRQTDLFLYFACMEWEDPLSSNIYKYINGTRKLNKEALKNIQTNDDWVSSKSPFAEAVKQDTSLFTDLEKLHQEYLPNIKPPSSCNDLLGNLIRFCFCGDHQRIIPEPTPEPTFKLIGTYHPTKSSIKPLIKRKDILENMQYLLEQKGMAILSAAAGMGKTCLFKYFYYENHGSLFTDFYHIEYKHSLDASIENIGFTTGRLNKHKTKWELLSLKSQDSLLFIDNMDCPPKKMAEELGRLFALKLKIIVATRNIRIPGNFPIIKVSPMNDSQLSEIYIQNNPNTESPQDVLQKLFELLDRSPTAVMLASKLASQKRYSAQELLTILKNSEFNTFEGSPKFKYNGSDLNYLGHIRRIYKKYRNTLQETERDMLKALSCFGNASIPRSLLTPLIYNVDDGWLQSMIDTGTLAETTPGTLKMQRLTADAVFLVEKPHYRSYKPLISELRKYIKNFRHSFHQAGIHDAFHEVASRLSYSVTDYNNPNQYSPSKEQEAWWEFILDGIIYLLSSGRTECASHLLENLYVTTKGTIQSHPYYIFKEILDIHNKWINGCCFDQLIFDIGQLQKYTIPGMQEHWQKPYQWLPALTYLEIIQMDFLHHFAMHSLMRSLLSRAASGTLSKNGVSLGFHLNDSSLRILAEFFLQTPCLEADERTYYLQICEYLGLDTFNPETLCYLTCKMYKNYQCCCLTSVRINYICILVLLFSACAVFSAAGFTVAVPHHRCLQHFKELLDAKISDADILPKMVSNLCITAYYYYAFCIRSTSGLSSAREQIEECCGKTPGLLRSEVDSILEIFDRTWTPA